MRGRRCNALLAGILAIASFAVTGGSAFAADQVVDTSADQNDGNCAAGQCSLRDAIGLAGAGETVSFANASIDPVLSMGEIFINKNLTIKGLGQSANTVSGNDASQVFFIVFPRVVTIKDLTVTDGKAPNGMPGVPGTIAMDGGTGDGGANGGGIYSEGTLTLERVTVSNSHAGNGGNGGAGFAATTPTNGGAGGAGGAGGGVFANGNGPLTMIDTTLRDNAAGNGGNGGNGAIDLDFANQPGSNGGNGGTAGGGGGLFASGPMTITNSTIGPNNQAGDGGDGAAAGNTPPGPPPLGVGLAGAGANGGEGGGIFAIPTGLMTLTNSTIANNSAGAGGDTSPGTSTPQPGGNGGNGGGIFVVGGALTGTHLTIANNSSGAKATLGSPAPTDGLGGGLATGFLGAATLTNSVLGSNTDIDVASMTDSCSGVVTNGGTMLSLAFPLGGCAGFSSGNPMLSGLASNGGPTDTMAISAAGDADDVVPNMGAGCTPTDQRGFIRPAPAAGLCDLGAFELGAVPPPPSPPVLTGTSPASGGNNNMPAIQGTAEAGTTVQLYTSPSCAPLTAIGAPTAEALFTTPGITVTVGDNSSTDFYAIATGPGGPSSCSTSTIQYDEVTPSEPPTPPPAGVTVTSAPTAVPATTTKTCKKGRKLKKGKCVKKKKKK